MAKDSTPKKVVQGIRCTTRRRFSAEEKIRIVLERLRGEEIRRSIGPLPLTLPNVGYRRAMTAGLQTRLAFLVVCSLTCGACSPGRAGDAGGPGPLAIAEQGDFYVGGRIVTVPATSSSGENDPNPGQVTVDQMYVQYQVPVDRLFALPVVMVHGSWHTGKTYGTTPDGREGWSTYFLRKGFPVYVVDDVNRGRSGYDMARLNEVRLGSKNESDVPPISRRTNEAAWTGFRIGPKPGVVHGGGQFPLESADQYFAQLTYNYRAVVEDQKIVDGLVALLDRIGPAVLLTHSQSGPFEWRTAAARPTFVKGIVAVEPIRVETFADFKGLSRVPVLLVRGDFEEASADAVPQQFVKRLTAAGGHRTFVRLPQAGIRGNSHMMKMERNNVQVAELIIDWIEASVAHHESLFR